MKAVLRLLALFAFLVPAAARAADGESFAIDQTLGRADAPVTIIEYASLTCPHCAHFAETTLPQVKEHWIETGRAKLIYRDFPTGPISLSIIASMVTHCSGPQRYFGVLELLFRTQERWGSARAPLDEIKRIVAVAGISPTDVDACLQREDLRDAILARSEWAAKHGIESTPTLVIDGQAEAGAATYEDLNAKLEKAYQAAAKK